MIEEQKSAGPSGADIEAQKDQTNVMGNLPRKIEAILSTLNNALVSREGSRATMHVTRLRDVIAFVEEHAGLEQQLEDCRSDLAALTDAKPQAPIAGDVEQQGVEIYLNWKENGAKHGGNVNSLVRDILALRSLSGGR